MGVKLTDHRIKKKKRKKKLIMHETILTDAYNQEYVTEGGFSVVCVRSKVKEVALVQE